ncbi:MAG: hypothetical protein WC872_04065 [Candidatus Absconditabacterales bacterium]|jgi:hypothetical protein
MSKKEYILKMLESLDGILPIANDLKVLVEGDVVSDELIDTLIDMFKEINTSIIDIDKKEKIGKSISFLEKLKQVEVDQYQKDDQRVKEIENMFSSI